MMFSKVRKPISNWDKKVILDVNPENTDLILFSKKYKKTRREYPYLKEKTYALSMKYMKDRKTGNRFGGWVWKSSL